MIVFTDDTVFAQLLFCEPITWKAIKPSSLGNDIRLPARYIFSVDHLYEGNIVSEHWWHFLLLVKSAKASQFEILCQLCRENKIKLVNMVCLAGSGKNFRGFRNRSWQSIPGNLHMSVYLAPQIEVAHFHVGFTLIAVNAAIQTLDYRKGIYKCASIKWVNDILIENRKVGGVLVQTQAQGKKVMGAVLGIGINVEQTPSIIPDIFVPQAGCLWDFSQKQDPFMKAHIFKDLLANLRKNYQMLVKGDFQALFDFYNQRSTILGQEVAIYSDPYQGNSQLRAQGKVTRIGKNLELYLEGVKDPIYAGRLAFTT